MQLQKYTASAMPEFLGGADQPSSLARTPILKIVQFSG